MKTQALLLVSTLLLFSAFTDDPGKNILGRWRVDRTCLDNTTRAIIQSVRKDNAAQADQLEQNFDRVKDLVAGLELRFNADKTYVLDGAQGPQSGTYSLSDDGQVVLMTPADRPARKDRVLELTSSRFRFIHGERGDTVLFTRP